jgi:hypothetical protein
MSKTPLQILEDIKNTPLESDAKVFLDTGIFNSKELLKDPAAAVGVVQSQINELLNKGISIENIGIVGLNEAFGDINAGLEDFCDSLGCAFGGALSGIIPDDSYFNLLNETVDNIGAIKGKLKSAKLPSDILIKKSILNKYTAPVDGKKTEGGEPLIKFPDTFIPEERPVGSGRGKTPISDFRDRSRVVTETAGAVAAQAWSESNSQFGAIYGKNVVYKSNYGHFIEMDDSEGAERLNIYHKNGTFITLMPDQSIVMRAQGGLQQVTYANNDIFVKGNINITVMGDVNISSNGNTNIDTVGDVNWRVGGDFNLDVIGDTSLFNTTGDIKMTSKQIRQNAGDPRVLDNVKKKEYRFGS